MDIRKRRITEDLMTDDILNKLLEKYNFDQVAEASKINNIPVNINNNDENKMLINERNHPSRTSHTYELSSNIGEILQKYSNNDHDDSNNTECDSYHFKNYKQLSSHDEDKSSFYDYAFKKFENKISNRYNADEDHRNINQNREFHSNRAYAEKSTYCRPVRSKEFIFRTLDRNAKLQTLLRKLIVIRRKEKENQWNNYIEELKNKHDNYSSRPKRIVPQFTPQDRFYLESNEFQKLKQNEYNKHFMGNQYVHAPFHEYYYPSTHETIREGFEYGHRFENEWCCYPTSSQGRIMMLERERARRNELVKSSTPYRSMDPHPRFVFVDKEDKSRNFFVRDKACCYPEPVRSTPVTAPVTYLTADKFTSTELKELTENSTACSYPCVVHDAVQTEQSNSSLKVHETTKEKYDRVTENVNRLKAQIISNGAKIHRQDSVWKIESKLEVLVKSLKHLVADLKGNNNPSSVSSLYKPETGREQIPPPGSLEARKNPKVTVGHVETTTLDGETLGVFQALPKVPCFQPSTRIDNILSEEMDKSNKLRRDLEEMLHTQTRQHSVQITGEIPTKERATEVTASLSGTVFCDAEVEEVESSLVKGSQTAIAVNTDPLGLLTLLTMSTDVVKQLVSFVPAVDYSWYLLRLLRPQPSGRDVADYVCNICGACFTRPSQLSDHMRNHDLGDVKDCCVCRHSLDLKRRPRGLFACRYCGQRFTRAYCCELHQQSCARALGCPHDVASSLALLR